MSDYARFLQRSRKRREKVARLKAQGMSLVKIARRMGITPQRAGQLAKACRTAA